MSCGGGHLGLHSLTLDPMGKMFQIASSLKPLGKLNPNCPGMIIGRSSTKFLFFLPIALLINQRLSRACIVHLVIKRTNWSYVKTMSCSGSHLGIPINIKNTKFVAF
jgi:hypothetical protein